MRRRNEEIVLCYAFRHFFAQGEIPDLGNILPDVDYRVGGRGLKLFVSLT